MIHMTDDLFNRIDICESVPSNCNTVCKYHLARNVSEMLAIGGENLLYIGSLVGAYLTYFFTLRLRKYFFAKVKELRKSNMW